MGKPTDQARPRDEADNVLRIDMTDLKVGYWTRQAIYQRALVRKAARGRPMPRSGLPAKSAYSKGSRQPRGLMGGMEEKSRQLGLIASRCASLYHV